MLLSPRSRSRAGSPGAPLVCCTVSPGTRVARRSVTFVTGCVVTSESTFSTVMSFGRSMRRLGPVAVVTTSCSRVIVIRSAKSTRTRPLSTTGTSFVATR